MEPENHRFRELQDLLVRHATNCDLREALPHVVLMSSTMPTHPKPVIAEPVFVLVAQGAKQAILAEQTFHYRAGQYLIVSVDLPLHGCVVRASTAEPYLAIGMLLKAELIAALLLESGIPPVPKTERAGIAVSDATEDIVDPVVRLLRLLDNPCDIPVLRASIEREILWRLINGEQGCLLRQLGLADSRASQIGRAIKWLRSHYCEPVRIEALAELAGMSSTSFHRHFRSITSLSPLQYQKQIRLQEARTRLLSGSDDVASIGYKVGYDSPSQFNREYKRLFGVPPGQDGDRLRSTDEADETVSPKMRQSMRLS